MSTSVPVSISITWSHVRINVQMHFAPDMIPYVAASRSNIHIHINTPIQNIIPCEYQCSYPYQSPSTCIHIWSATSICLSISSLFITCHTCHAPCQHPSPWYESIWENINIHLSITLSISTPIWLSECSRPSIWSIEGSQTALALMKLQNHSSDQ